MQDFVQRMASVLFCGIDRAVYDIEVHFVEHFSLVLYSKPTEIKDGNFHWNPHFSSFSCYFKEFIYFFFVNRNDSHAYHSCHSGGCSIKSAKFTLSSWASSLIVSIHETLSDFVGYRNNWSVFAWWTQILNISVEEKYIHLIFNQFYY